MNDEMSSNMRRLWHDTCKNAGLVAVGRDKAARLLAVLYVYGGESEDMTHSPSLLADMDYVQEAYGFRGGMVPDGEVVKRMRGYVDELEVASKVPVWAATMMSDEYGVVLR